MRSLYKGNYIVTPILLANYGLLWKSCLKIRESSISLCYGTWDRPHGRLFLKLYRRNTIITKYVQATVKRAQLTMIVYNGYDFFPRTLNKQVFSRVCLNISGLVSCLSLNVRHKSKITKHQKAINHKRSIKKKEVPKLTKKVIKR